MKKTTFVLPGERMKEAGLAAVRGRGFVLEAGFPLGAAMIDHAWSGGAADAAIRQLAGYQNDDGGFGRGLEVDIESPVSNPFAARLAMAILLGLDDRPSTDLRLNLQRWLIANQDEDGDWHFSDETKSAQLAPWFAGWTFPSLNPACCLAGYANRLGIATPAMLDRVARLFDEKSSLDEARSGEFYALLPYVEYIAGVDWPGRAAFVEATVEGISAADRTGKYADAGHFWEHVLGGGPDIAGRISTDVLSKQADALLGEQLPDGGWPTPYNDAWRPLFTAQSCITLAQLRDGI
ncbi:MAG: hypothetical protein H0V37_12710 [Chloroflexia bacterium]|nr:hypothetical protein [Chloroflexia bacterium]